MCCGCDVKPDRFCGQPNPLTIEVGRTVLPDVTRDALLIVVGNESYDGGALTVRKEGSNATTLRGGRGILLPCAGRWIVDWNGRAAVSAVLVEAYCGAAFAAFVRKGPGRVLQSAPTLTASASTVVVAANAFRKSLVLQARETNADRVWMSTGEAAASGRGFSLEPGEKFTMDGEGCHPFVMNGFSTAADIVNVVEGD